MVTGLQGAIIAAGRGERLRTTPGALPKPLVELGGESLLVRQARALLAAGAASVVAVINSETAALMKAADHALPPGAEVVVRDTANSMETMLALGELLEPGWFLASTVDTVLPAAELARFVLEAQGKISRERGDQALAGILGVTRWRGDEKPLFVNLTETGLIARLGGGQTEFVTAGVYFLSTKIFGLADEARRRGCDALRRFLGLVLDSGLQLGAIELNEAIDIDTPRDLAAAREAIRKQQ